MPRQGHNLDPDRVRRAAAAFLDGDCERACAVERSGATASHFNHVVQAMRREREALQPPAGPRLPAVRLSPMRGSRFGAGPESTRQKNTRRAALVRRAMALASNLKSAGG